MEGRRRDGGASVSPSIRGFSHQPAPALPSILGAGGQCLPCTQTQTVLVHRDCCNDHHAEDPDLALKAPLLALGLDQALLEVLRSKDPGFIFWG